jgi:uncharacterized protein (DUF2342 family)
MQEMCRGQENLFGTVMDDEQRLKLGRIQAFMTSAEGYGDHVMHASRGRQMLVARTDGSTRRCAATARASTVDPVFERLLGSEVNGEAVPDWGRAFCDTVVELDRTRPPCHGMWDSAEGSPSMPRARGAASVARPQRLGDPASGILTRR